VPILMAADVSATVDLDRVVAHASVGYGLRNVGPIVAWSPDEGPNNALVSRAHWVGVTFLDRELIARAGRIQLPFGLRNVEHTTFVRSQTSTGLALDQQHGFSLAYSGGLLRGEAMAIFGNFQLRPAKPPNLLRQKGYSAVVELAPFERFTIGASSKLTLAFYDLELGSSGTYEDLRDFAKGELDAGDIDPPIARHAHGMHLRWAPLDWCVVLAEGDATLVQGPSSTALGGVGWLQVDFEPWQGVHIMPALEARHVGDGLIDPAGGAWLSLSWHPLPHTEVRADGIYRQVFDASGPTTGSFTGLLQAHFFL
jgi:hypothetical protein